MVITIGLIHLIQACFIYKMSWLNIMSFNCQYWGVCIAHALEGPDNVSIVFISGDINTNFCKQTEVPLSLLGDLSHYSMHNLLSK